MKVSNLNNFREFLRAPIYVGRDTGELQKEIDTNFWAINITAHDQRILKEDDFQVLFRRIYAKSYTYIRNSGHSHGLIFYLWFDEQASQLRFSFISDFHEELPFTVTVKNVSFAEVIHQCLNSKIVSGIPSDELARVKGSPVDAYQDNESENGAVDVYVQHIGPFVE